MMAHIPPCMPPFRTLLTCAPLLNPAAIRSLHQIAHYRTALSIALLQTSFCTKFSYSSKACSLPSSTPQPARVPALKTVSSTSTIDHLVNASQKPPLAPGLYLVSHVSLQMKGMDKSNATLSMQMESMACWQCCFQEWIVYLISAGRNANREFGGHHTAGSEVGSTQNHAMQ